MNYRHAFHAGNFADVVKHAALTQCLDLMTRRAGHLTVIDTHAGAGLYDLRGGEAARSGEAERGIARLMSDADAPEALDILSAAVSRINGGGALDYYPGSPLLALAALRPGDRLVCCELASAEHARLAELLDGDALALEADGFDAGVASLPREGQALLHIDPPYERGDDYVRAAQAAAAAIARNPGAVVMIWLPLKDLETFDAFLRRLEAAVSAPVTVAEARLRPLDDPSRMNGCALAVLNPPDGLPLALAEICRWVAQSLGDAGADARVWNL
jgi:23S rRNA (adenine2030-N6)-methyltransferase